MLNFRPATDRDAALCRQVGLVFVWLTTAAGVFLLWHTVTTPVHILMAVGLLLLPLLSRSSARRAERITARVIGGVMWGLALLFLAQTVSTVSVGWSIASPELAVSLCVFGGNLLHLLIHICLHKIVKNGGNAVESLPGIFHSLYGVFKGRGFWIIGNCINLSLGLGNALFESRHIMLISDFVKLRSSKRKLGLRQKRIFHFAR